MILDKYTIYSDRQIVEGIVNNEKPIIEYFFLKKCPKLLIYIANSVFDDRVDYRELFGELYLYLAKDNWAVFRQFQYRSSLMTYMSVVAVRFFQKKRAELLDFGSYEALREYMSAGLPAHSVESKIDIRSALEIMPNKKYRQVLIDLDIKDKAPEDVAKEMNVSVANLYNIHRRAREQMQLILGRKEDYYD